MQTQSEREPPPKLDLRCTACGYGAVRSAAPERCPMCQAEHAWIDAPHPSVTVLSTRRPSP
jgi:rubrerythrin